MVKIKNLLNFISSRNFSVTQSLEGKRNFRKFVLANKRGTAIFKKKQFENPDPEIPFYSRGLRPTGYTLNGKFYNVLEMMPQLVVPDLKDCTLKPYVSYRVPDISQPEHTAYELFQALYAPKIEQDLKNGNLDENGNPLKPSEEEKLTAEEAYINARKTGSDLC